MPKRHIVLTALILLCAAASLADVVSVGEFTRIYDPSVGMDKQWYIDDHCCIMPYHEGRSMKGYCL